MMEKGKKLYEGKAKIIYATKDKNQVIHHFKDDATAFNNKKKTTITSLYKDNDSIDFLVCFGGDGTILDAVTIVKNTEIPIIGINTGRLGFLATISKNEIPLLMTDLFNKKYTPITNKKPASI